jgi:hypothetical protein
LPSQSLIQPEKSLEIEAVASPTPSMRPTASVLALRTIVRKIGNRPMNHLRGYVREHADEAERPDAAREAGGAFLHRGINPSHFETAPRKSR